MPDPKMQVNTVKSTSVAGAMSSPHLRTPITGKQHPNIDLLVPNADSDNSEFEEDLSAISRDVKNKCEHYKVTEYDLNRETVIFANELKDAVLKSDSPVVRTNKRNLHHKEETLKRRLFQYSEDPLLPLQASQNTIFVKAPRQRASLIQKNTTFDKGAWTTFSRLLTCCFPTLLITKCTNMRKPDVIQAWREKVALCLLFATLMAILAFITFLVSATLCPVNFNTQVLQSDQKPTIPNNSFAALGSIYVYNFNYGNSLGLTFDKANELDISPKMIADRDATPYCGAVDINPNELCNGNCVKQSDFNTPIINQIRYSWSAIQKSKTLFVYNGYVVNITQGSPFIKLFFSGLSTRLMGAPGKDITYFSRESDSAMNAMRCFAEAYKIGYIDNTSFGCLTRDFISDISLIVILIFIFTRFILAVGYSWFLSRKLGAWEKHYNDNNTKGNEVITNSIMSVKQSLANGVAVDAIDIPVDFRTVYSILMVTCYSEDELGLKTTLDSLCDVSYPNKYKLIIVVCDGLVTGGGQTKNTPEIVLGLIQQDKSFGKPEPKSYLSIANGGKRHNMATIHCGQYVSTAGKTTNIIVIVKCGTPEESHGNKPGNRGKRDSQIILMDFCRAVMFNAPMSPFQYELFNKIYKLTNNTADKYEIVLMVDADTKVQSDALNHMSAVVSKDPMIMGLCGETRIMNKSESWTTAIQVFEYHIAHHLAKAFESCFGGVTCLPGCFCLYRIKAPRGDGTWTPILASPEIVEQYSENVVNTLHKKNLLLLGEDRFLSTLMLRTFPNRKMMFVPKAVCKTSVPNKFKVLLSQRRRWINSTVHNLFELLMVRELCGTFCFSMQFVVFLELIGTLSLPAAIIFTVYLKSNVE